MRGHSGEWYVGWRHVRRAMLFAGKIPGQAKRGMLHPRSTPLPPLAAIICNKTGVAFEIPIGYGDIEQCRR